MAQAGSSLSSTSASLSRSALFKVLLLFMLGIILPAGFLAYLGVLSIRSETLLLKKESQERVGKTAQAIRDQAQSVISEALSLKADAPSTSLFLTIDPAGRLLSPLREVRRQPAATLRPLPESLREKMQKAEDAEFHTRDYTSALSIYRSVQKQVDSPRWKAILLTSMAGCLAKSGQYDAAETQYQEILSRYGQETDQEGYPFGLVIASQLAELQKTKGRPDLAITYHLRVFQDLISGRWDLGWEEWQFFIRHISERLHELEDSMSSTEKTHYQNLEAQADRIRQTGEQARDFIKHRWPALQRTLREKDRAGSAFLIFTDSMAQKAIVYAPLYESSSGNLQQVALAEISSQPLLEKLRRTIDPLCSASNLAYDLELEGHGQLASSAQGPEGKRWAFTEPLAQTDPALRLLISPVSDLPVERAAARRRQVYLGMVILAAVVILIALYATWYAVSREVEVAQLKARFVASISHELKTPLSIINMIGQKLQLGRYESQAEIQDYYTMISEETTRLKSLIDDVLDFSRLMENRQPYRKEPTDLVALVKETVERFRHSLKEGNVKLECRCELVSCIALVDREAMSRVLINLMDNAVKYSPPDRAHITVTLKKKDREAVIQVQDEGFGIPAEEQKLVFDRFYRGQSASEFQKTNGVGLGLSIVQHIVAAHGGQVELQSTAGKGSIFSILIPMSEA